MKRNDRVLLGVLLWCFATGVAAAETSPAKVVQQFIDAHLQGRFAEARSFTLERVNLRGSLFSNWLFGPGGTGGDAATADVFLSRKFSQAFRYSIVGNVPSGDNQLYVTVMRVSPNLTHLYTWALAPKQGAPPYELIDAIDTYLTKVNYPVEESRMQFTLVREVDEWYISAIYDERFVQLQQQWLSRPPFAAAPPAGAGSVAPPGSAGPPAVAAGAPPLPAVTTTSDDPGRQIADAQFNATLQSFNRTYQPPAGAAPPAAAAAQEKPSFFDRVASIFGGGKGKTSATISSARMQRTLRDIRDALARYTAANQNYFPDSQDIYDWQSLRQLVNRYGKNPLPPTESEAGFTFVSYNRDNSRVDYRLVIDLHEPQDGVKRVEVTPSGVDRAG